MRRRNRLPRCSTVSWRDPTGCVLACLAVVPPTPLSLRLFQDDTATVKRLLDMGASPNSNTGDDQYGNSPVHWCCWHGKVSCLELLLKAGANPSAVNAKGEWPLDTARARREYRRKKFQRASKKGAEARLKSGLETAEDPDVLYGRLETLFRGVLSAEDPQLHGKREAERDAGEEAAESLPPGFRHGRAIPLASYPDTELLDLEPAGAAGDEVAQEEEGEAAGESEAPSPMCNAMCSLAQPDALPRWTTGGRWHRV